MNTSSSMRAGGFDEHELPRAPTSVRNAPKRSWRRAQQARIAVQAAAIWKVLKPYPSTVVWPLVVLGAVLLAGVWGVTRVAQATADSTKDRVGALATDVGTWYRQSIVESYAPVISISVVIYHDPTFSEVQQLFNNAAEELMVLAPPDALRSLQLAPNGVIQLVHPAEGNYAVVGHRLFDEPDRNATLATIRNGRLALMGPLTFIQGGYGVRARLPVFIRNVDENTTWGAPSELSPICGSLCYDATTRTKFWGFSTALIELQKLHSSEGSRLRAIAELGYDYELLAPDWDVDKAVGNPDNMTRVSSSDRLPVDPVEVKVNLPQSTWLLRVSPRKGWYPSWYPPLLAGVIVLAVSVSVLMFAVLLSRRQHQALLEALLPRELIDHLRKENAECRLGPRIMESATTAEVLLNMLGEMLEGITPDLRDIVLIRQQILQNMDIYQPLNLSSQLRDANLDDDVTKALIHQLGGKFSFSVSAPNSDIEDFGEGGDLRSGAALHRSLTMGQQDYATLAGALSMILSPQGGWYDSGPDVSDAASDAALPTHDTEVAISPRPSNTSLFGRAASHLIHQTSFRCASPEPYQAIASPLGPQGSCSGPAGAPGSAFTSAASQLIEAAAAIAPSPARPQASDGTAAGGERLVVATSSAISTSCVRVTEDGGTGGGAAAAAAAGGGTATAASRRPPRKGDSHTSLIGLSRARRKSALLTVSIADGVEGGGGGGGGGGHGKTLSSGGHPDVLMALPHGEHHLNNGRLWAATVSRRSITGGAGIVYGALLAKKPPTPSAPVIEEVERVLAQADTWQFDTWRLREVTNGHPLSALGYYLIQRAGLIGPLKLKPVVLARLLRHIEAGYNDNPYHNATHAADVLQTLHVIIHGARMHTHYLDHLGLLAAYFAAIVHDYGHPGLTNDFLVATSDPLAVRYNDRSPLENHHAAAAFSSMRRSGLDMLAPLPTEQKSAFRKQVIEMVLATDMKQHFSLLSHFSTVHRLSSYTNKPAATATGAATPLSHQGSNLELQRVSVNPPSILEMAPKPIDDTERLLSLQIAIKAADLGHLGEGLDVHKKWLCGLEEEFFRQGDKERQLVLPVSPLFDRAKQGVSKSQVGFFDFVALPLVHALSGAFPGTEPLMTCFLGNYNYYRSFDSPPVATEPRNAK